MRWLEKHERRIVWFAIIGYAAIFSLICAWKYRMFAYNGIDLAYFNQVFWNTVRGRPFMQSIHPHLSLGDHAELAIVLLAPLYAIVQSPITLLALQSVALALPAYPLWRIAKLRMSSWSTGAGDAVRGPREGAGVARARRALAGCIAAGPAPVLFALLWLASPFVQNINLFEFHILPFALAPLMFALLEYERGRKAPFLAWCVAALLCREDVALAVAMIGVLAWFEKKSRWWIVAPLALGTGWFVAALALVSHFAPEGSYKFMAYYSWLGATPGAVALGALLHPLRVLAHVFSLANLEMALGFLMPFAFLPLLAPLRLLLLLGPLAQILLGAPGGGELILDTHYATLFLPALFLATIDGAKRVPALLKKQKKFAPDDARRLALGAIGISALYSMLLLGPLPAVVSHIATGDMNDRATIARAAVAAIPNDGSVAASYSLLPALSSRERLTSLHYLFLGVTQFGEAPYEPPPDLRFVALDNDDLLTYRAQFLSTGWTAPHCVGGISRLEKITGAPIFFRGPFVIYDHTGGTASGPPQGRSSRECATSTCGVEAMTGPVPEQQFSDGIALGSAAVSVERDPVLGVPLMRIAIAWRGGVALADDLAVHLRIRDERGAIVHDGRYPLTGLAPESAPTAEGVMTNFAVPIFGQSTGPFTEDVQLERNDDVYVISGIRSAERKTRRTAVLGTASLPSEK